MRLGVCTYGWTPTVFPEGLDYLEASIPKLLVPREPESVFDEKRREVADCPLPIEGGIIFLPSDLKSTGPEVNEQELDAFVETTLRRAHAVGMKVIAFGSGGSRKVPEGFPHEEAMAQLEGHLKRWSVKAQELGLVFAVEPLKSAETNIINRVSEGAELARRVGKRNVGVLADTYHMMCEGEGPDAIVSAGELIVHVHCAEEEGRSAPGTHGEDFRPFFRALKEIDYQGRISIESGWGDPQKELAGAVRYLREQYETA